MSLMVLWLYNNCCHSKDGDSSIVQLPFLCFTYHQPSDGLPLIQEWLNTAQDIYHGGYEATREPMEVVATDESLAFGTVSVSKGLGRMSILWFGVLFSYFKLKDGMLDDVKADFKRWGPVGILSVAFGGTSF